MKKLIRKIFFIFMLVSFFRLLAVSTCVSQHGFECGFIDSSGSFSSSIFDNQFTGLTKPIRTDLSGDSTSPSDAVFPVIIVFVQFLGDNDDWQWPTGQPPLYLDSIIAETKSYNSDWWDAYDKNTEQFSDYWLEVSRGKFHVTGKAFSVVLDKNANGYASDHEINLEIWRKLHEEIVDWRPYDRWRDTLINGQMKFFYEQDGYVDMIYKVHKNNAGPLWDERGYAHLTQYRWDFSYVLVDTANQINVGNGFRGKGSGVTVSFTARKFHNMLALQHEHGHGLYADGHITYGKVSYGPGGDGFFSPYEMILLKYQSPDTVNFAAQNNYYLGDYSARNSANGEILRVPIQGEECYLITNRSNASKWDKIMLGDSIQTIGPYDYTGDYGKGIYINHIKSTGIFFPSGDQHVQDLECADGVWHWSYKGQKQRYAWDAGYCYITPSLWDYYLRDSVSYDNDGGWNINSADARSYSYTIWAGIGKNDECKIGTDRTFTNSEEIYANEEVLGDRYDAWNVGYNEIFSPYSSPNTKTMSNSSSGIYIWLYSNSGSGPTSSAAFKIYKAGEGGHTDSSILQITPPSRPMGLIVMPCDSQPSINGFKRIRLKWNHNMEPDMERTLSGEEGLFKRYKIYRSAATDMGSVPDDAMAYSENYYDLIATININKNSNAAYTDEELISICNTEVCTPPNYCIEYPVRYRVQAVDKYDDVSVLSDFVNTRGGSLEASSGNRNASNQTGEGDSELPLEYSLSQNYPNPFNPETNIKYDLPFGGLVTLKIYDILGKEVYTLINEYKDAGRYVTGFNGSDMSSGIYYYTIRAGGFVQTKRMILLK